MNEMKIRKIVRDATEEDIGTGDITTDNIVDESEKGKGIIRVKEKSVVAGLKVAEMVFNKIDPELEFIYLKKDGDEVDNGTEIAEVVGEVNSILKGERLALNFLQRMSGIATNTRKYVDRIQNYETKVVDTRKTTPNLRILEKWAVRLGGGQNHRMGLYDAVLIKDNHIKAAGSIGEAVSRVKRGIPHTTKIEVEVEDIEGVKEALDNDVNIIMLDNMSLEDMNKSVGLIGKEALTEASGGITLDNIKNVAETGVDFISVGALTHQIRSIDISLDLI
ncbi:MAG: carboxylating nicotinate-nucleotide diphosphorylase [Thermoplasmatota archaeon]